MIIVLAERTFPLYAPGTMYIAIVLRKNQSCVIVNCFVYTAARNLRMMAVRDFSDDGNFDHYTCISILFIPTILCYSMHCKHKAGWSWSPKSKHGMRFQLPCMRASILTAFFIVKLGLVVV